MLTLKGGRCRNCTGGCLSKCRSGCHKRCKPGAKSKGFFSGTIGTEDPRLSGAIIY